MLILRGLALDKPSPSANAINVLKKYASFISTLFLVLDAMNRRTCASAIKNAQSDRQGNAA